MAKTAIDAPRSTVFLVRPERLTLVRDKEHPLYDPRAEDAPDERMVANIAMHGVLEPILVRRNGAEIEVIAGRGRTKAAVEANKRLLEEGKPAISVPVIIRGGSDADLFGILVSENEIRREDTMLAKGAKARKLLNYGYTVQQIAVTFGASRQAVESWLAADGLPQPIKDAVEAGEMAATAALKMAGRPRGEQAEIYGEFKRQGKKPTAQAMREAAALERTKAAPKLKSRNDMLSRLEAYIDDDSDFATGYKAALLWAMGEERGDD